MSEPAPRRFARQIRFLRARVSPEGYLGLHLTAGLLVILAAGWWFGDIAEDMSRNVATRLLDDRVTSWFHQHATPGLTQIMSFATFFGSVVFIASMSTGAALILIARKFWYRLLALVIAVGGGGLLNILLKHFFHRQRPVLENPLVTISSFGFPSGHTMGSALFYGCLALFVAQSVRTWWLRAGIFCIAAMWVALIGLSRIYLGAHYLTDVLGAISVGVAWLAFCWTGVETLRKWRGGPSRQN
ncbi:MAG TPA: phosphatase PAP2 family protein [Chthoniobacterales bacterium]|nr:phosphatase PAP2 family protein [Chthoniobacterales bacterium]